MTTTSLPAGELGVPYSTSLQASGGTPPYDWSLLSSSQPIGLVFQEDGTITGIPIVGPGTFAFTVRVSDASDPQRHPDATLSLTVAAYTGSGYAVSGAVSMNGFPLSGVVLSGLPGNPITTGSGHYITFVPPGWSGTVTPTLAGFAFDPPVRTYASV